MPLRVGVRHPWLVHVLTPRRDPRITAGTSAATTIRALSGGLLLVTGVGVGWLDLATPILGTIELSARQTAIPTIAGVAGWFGAVVLPFTLVAIGAVRLRDVVDRSAARRGSRSRTGLAARLGDGFVVSDRVRLPDGTVVPRIVLGPHGLAILETAPPPEVTRHRDGRWEARLRDGGWVPIENPLDRASRDADRVRAWFASDDRDFVLKVHAALVAPDAALRRTPTCAVITDGQIPAWLGSLPAQRTLTPNRRSRIARFLLEGI